MKEIKAGIVASGMMGQRHIDAVRRVAGAKVLAIADPWDKGLEAKAEEMGIPYVFRDYREMIDTLPIDVVHNCTPNSEHYEVSRYALEQGVHVYSEKPLAAESGQAEELTRLAAENKLICGVNFNYRNNAAVQEMRARMANRDAGRCFLARASYLQDWLMYEEDYNWRMEKGKGANPGPWRTSAPIASTPWRRFWGRGSQASPPAFSPSIPTGISSGRRV